MSATVACGLLLAGLAGFAAAVWGAERFVFWLVAGRRPARDVLADAGGHVRRTS